MKETFSLFSSVLELAGIQDYLKLGIDQTTAAERGGAGAAGQCSSGTQSQIGNKCLMSNLQHNGTHLINSWSDAATFNCMASYIYLTPNYCLPGLPA